MDRLSRALAHGVGSPLSDRAPPNAMFLAVALGLLLLVALAIGEGSTFARASVPGWLPGQPGAQIARVHGVAGAFLPVRSAACAADSCRGAGDQCAANHCCGGQGPGCSGGVVAPALAGLLASPPSTDRMTAAHEPAMAGVSRPPDEPPPRLF